MCLRLTRKLRLRISKRSNLLRKRRIRSSRLGVRPTTAGLRDVSRARRPQRTRRSISIRAMMTRKSPHSWKSMTVRGTRYSLGTFFDLLVTSRRSRWHSYSRWERTGCSRLNFKLRCLSPASLVRSRTFTSVTHRLLKLERGTMQALSY
jgi:hypothetical protein